MSSPDNDGSAVSEAKSLYFFPDEELTSDELEEILASDDEGRRLWAISQLLRYAQWEDIWRFVSREEVRRVFPSLDLPDNLRAAWARMLKIEAPVG